MFLAHTIMWLTNARAVRILDSVGFIFIRGLTGERMLYLHSISMLPLALKGANTNTQGLVSTVSVPCGSLTSCWSRSTLLS